MRDTLMTKTVSDRLRGAGVIVVGFADLAPLVTKPGRGQVRGGDGPDAGCDECALALPGRRRLDYDLDDACVPLGGDRRNGGVRGT